MYKCLAPSMCRLCDSSNCVVCVHFTFGGIRKYKRSNEKFRIDKMNVRCDDLVTVSQAFSLLAFGFSLAQTRVIQYQICGFSEGWGEWLVDGMLHVGDEDEDDNANDGGDGVRWHQRFTTIMIMAMAMAMAMGDDDIINSAYYYIVIISANIIDEIGERGRKISFGSISFEEVTSE